MGKFSKLMQGFLLLGEQAEWEIQMGRPYKAITYLDRWRSSCLSVCKTNCITSDRSSYYSMIIVLMTIRAINIHPDDTFILTMRAQASLSLGAIFLAPILLYPIFLAAIFLAAIFDIHIFYIYLLLQ